MNAWLPALDGVVKKLSAGGKVADVGCGHGSSTVLMAEAFPASAFYGYDFHTPSISVATEKAKAASVQGNTCFVNASASALQTAQGDPMDFDPQGKQ